MELLNDNLTDKQIAQLVAGLIPRNLPSVPMSAAIRLPRHIVAIYFVFLGDRLVYIGQTEDLARRWMSHHVKRDPDYANAIITYLQLPQRCSYYGFRRHIERAFIWAYLPMMNQRWPAGPVHRLEY